MTREQIIMAVRGGKFKVIESYLKFANLQEALESKGFKQSDEEIKTEAFFRNNPPKIPQKEIKSKVDKVTTESNKI
jgi:hypothetical protein